MPLRWPTGRRYGCTLPIWLPLTVLLALVLLPPIKGALVGLQWALLMHGFDPNAEEEKIESFDAGVRRRSGPLTSRS